MARSKSSNRWLQEHFQDPFVKKAKAQGFRSRAAFKLLQIQQKYKVLKPGMTVVDLGAAPGGWSQVACEILGDRGSLYALDLLPMDTLPGVHWLQGDFNDQQVYDKLQNLLGDNKVDVVLSDMAPNISGNKSIDGPRMMSLVELAGDFAEHVLAPGGAFLTKVFQGSGFAEFYRHLQQNYQHTITIKPEASRSRTPEVYVLARGYQKNRPGS